MHVSVHPASRSSETNGIIRPLCLAGTSRITSRPYAPGTTTSQHARTLYADNVVRIELEPSATFDFQPLVSDSAQLEGFEATSLSFLTGFSFTTVSHACLHFLIHLDVLIADRA